MYEIVFILLFVTLMLVSVLMVVYGLSGLSTVKAGKVSKHCPRIVLYNSKDYGVISVDGRTVSVSGMLHLAVCGNSMRDYNILDGQEIYARRYEDDESKVSIEDHPVLVLKITKASFYDSQYKLRKFVDYGSLNNTDIEWETVFERNTDRIKMGKEDFIRKCLVKVEKLKKLGITGQVVLSETYDEEKNYYDYSLHPVTTICASVEYVIS